MGTAVNKGLSPQSAQSGYDLKVFGSVTTTIGADTGVQVPMATVRDANGDDAIGTPGTNITQPTGGSAQLGWLSGTYKKAVDIDATLIAANEIHTASSTKISEINAKTPALVEGNTPVNIAAYTYTQSASNTTTSNLAAGGLWEGTIEDAFSQPSVQVMANANQPYKVSVYQYQDAAGSKQSSVSTFIRDANAPVSETIQVNSNYVKVQIVNLGTAATTSLYVDTTYGPLNPFPTQLTSSGNFRVAVQEQSGRITGTYMTGQALTPTTLAANSMYFTLRNASATKRIEIESVQILCGFTGTAAASRSSFSIRKYTGATGSTGVTTLSCVPLSTSDAASVAEAKSSPGTSALTGGTSVGSVFVFGHANQLTANAPYTAFDEATPLPLLQNEAIAIVADTAIILGSLIHVNVKWREVTL